MFWQKFHLWNAVIGQSASVTNLEWSVDDVVYIWLQKFITNVKVLTFKRNILKFYFEIKFRNKFSMWKGFNSLSLSYIYTKVFITKILLI